MFKVNLSDLENVDPDWLRTEEEILTNQPNHPND